MAGMAKWPPPHLNKPVFTKARLHCPPKKFSCLAAHADPPPARMFTVNMYLLTGLVIMLFLIVRVAFIYVCQTYATAFWCNVDCRKQTLGGGPQMRVVILPYCKVAYDPACSLKVTQACWRSPVNALTIGRGEEWGAEEWLLCVLQPMYRWEKDMLSLQSVQPNVVMYPSSCDTHRAVPVNNPVCLSLWPVGCVFVEGSVFVFVCVFLPCLLLYTHESPWQLSHRPASCSFK